MRAGKILLLVVGTLAALLGLVWIGQGTGYFPYPAGNFMIDQTVWAYRGVGLAIAGLVAIVVSRRL
ncbi:MAG: hypothetical protein QOJ54_3031 [Aliidongia sp.]|jgi:hypothetical protein|nr:hypothetical protein [Aliidongia sp.]